MTIAFNADEILAMAENIERIGGQFYRKAAATVKGAPRQTLENLAAMEDNHLKTFSDMRANLSGRELEPTTRDPQGESALYLQALVDGRVFDTKADPSAEIGPGADIRQILHKAIELEKDSVLFYLGLKDVVPLELGQDKLDAIIHEEMTHITLLGKELAALGPRRQVQ